MIEGLDKLLKKLDNIEPLVEKAVEKGLEKSGTLIEADAKTYVPVDTGALKESIYHKVEDNTLEVGATMPYAIFVEFGTYKQRPQPYLTPAIEGNRQKMVDIISKEIEEALR